MKAVKICAVLASLSVFGCKTIVSTDVKLSELVSSETKEISGDVHVEVAGCKSYEDSRQDSEALLRIKNTVPRIFKGAKFQECFTKMFESYAHFSVPITLDKDKDDQLASNSSINIISNDDTLLAVGIPPQMNAKLEQIKRESFDTTSFDLEVDITVINDMKKAHSFNVMSAYIDEKPYVFANFTARVGDSFVVSLSDVSIDQAKSSTPAQVLLY